GLRRACDEAGALLVFDEVITGFRVGRGAVSTQLAVTPDLWCFGKVIGGGLPVGAFGGRRSVLEVLAPGGPVYQAGTLSGNPLAVAAGRAVLDAVRPDDYEALGERVSVFAAELGQAVSAAGLPVSVPVFGPLVGIFFTDDPVVDAAGARSAASGDLYRLFFAAMLERGVALAPGPYEVMFPGFSHGEEELSAAVEAAGEAAAQVAAHSHR
ncbi:MAG: aminotransferase class III-fold pyridoxal phosphate-dependent enzyme, partial [Acidimicrobiales bacterium]